MFVKSNPKGMAMLVHSLLTSFDTEEGEIRSRLALCWFPYTMVELKDFKQIALQVCSDLLIPQGRVQPNILTKALLETASGVKIWQSLRTLSDYALMDRMHRSYSKAELKAMPSAFVQSVMQARREMGEEGSSEGENRDPNQTSQMSAMGSAVQ